jgi:NDP-sugar pyrophosphorylase family protein/aminoglycoside/choline kinase family phosphotransferase
MKPPCKAVLLAAGFGTRMDPLSGVVPKPLLPLWNRPMIDHTLDLLRDWGVTHVYINVHHHAEQVIQHVATRRDTLPKLTIAYEPVILGTGGVLRAARAFIGKEPFWMINGDIAADLDPRPLINQFARQTAAAVLWVTAQKGPRTVAIQHNVISSFAAARPGCDGTFTFCGLQLIDPAMLRHLPRRSFSSIIEAYAAAARKGRAVLGVEIEPSFWADIGTPDGYIDAHRDTERAYRAGRPGRRLYDPRQTALRRHLRRRGVTVQGCVALPRDARIAAGAVLRDSVVGPASAITAGAVLNRAVTAPGTRVTGSATGIVVGLERLVAPDLLLAARSLNWPVQKTVAVRLPPRGSDRVFTRLRNGRRQVMVIRYGSGRPENDLYVRQARFLQSTGVVVPRILLNRPSRRLIVMEDVGDCSLTDLVTSGPASSLARRYRAAIRNVVTLHTAATEAAQRRAVPLSEPFAPGLYAWERALFDTHFLDARLQLDPAQRTAVMQDLERVEQRLADLPPVLLHRDLQSSNILFHRGRPVLIDFQGMRFGPAVYDLASLLCDPYVCLPPGLQMELLRYYASRTGQDVNALASRFWYGAVQRLAQAIGAYGRLSAHPETKGFERFFRPGLKMMQRALGHVEGLDALRGVTGRAAQSMP